MSGGLSTLLAYEEEEEEEDEQRQQVGHRSPERPSAHQHHPAAQPPSPAPSPPASSSPLPATPSDAPTQLTSSFAHKAEAERREEQKHAEATQPLIRQPATDASHAHDTAAAPLPRPSSPLVTPQLHRLIMQLPPIPQPLLPSNPDAIAAYSAALPYHLRILINKRVTSHSPSLVDQLTALPAFHNPAILQRVAAARGVDQHATLCWEQESDREREREREDEMEEDSVEGMKRQTKREQKQREQQEKDKARRAEEEERKRQQQRQQQQHEAAAAAEQQRQQQLDTQRAADGATATSTLDASLLDWRDRELRKRREAAMHTHTAAAAAVHSSAAASSGAVASVAGVSAATVMDAKRLEAMRRAEEINKRLRKM